MNDGQDQDLPMTDDINNIPVIKTCTSRDVHQSTKDLKVIFIWGGAFEVFLFNRNSFGSLVHASWKRNFAC